ncbi:hypothetical protein HO173_011128 [Letharia columbiana]|uniref:dihydroorotase n=1 Tax=Letharia columbiana TaxID=112416 RepID=A0A8H6FL80_9LECA|nr:uncharacterized protein HO173_011128 [Letharia columbiana]KAF6230591.1 hypothetical protein HO173_011128 [Letharia columbiana]
MLLSEVQSSLRLPAGADFHVHLRDGPMMELVVPTIRRGGIDLVYVMPNLNPPITNVQQCLDYQTRLQAMEPNVRFLMSLYLNSSITPATIYEAKRAGIVGVKMYPANVTTGSSQGVTDYAAFYPVLAEMERQDMILNLHGECPSVGDVTVMSAESAFLPILSDYHTRFPRLRIVLEHLSTAAAVSAVAACGETVAASITSHHLSLIVDDWQNDVHCNCKPVAKLPSDRAALLRAAISGNPKFFFGSDSAPHPIAAKKGGDKIAAGVFTQPYTTQSVVDALEKAVEWGVLKDEDVTVERLKGFMGDFGRRFYKVESEPRGEIELRRGEDRIMDVLQNDDQSVQVVPFRRGEKTWGLSWVQ